MCSSRDRPRSTRAPVPKSPFFFSQHALRRSDEGVGVHGVLDLLRLQRRRQLQRQQRLHHAVAVRRRRALAAGAVGHLAAVEEVVALEDEGLDHRLVQLGGGQRVLVLEVRTHQRRPEADGQVVGRHQRGLAVLADPGAAETARQEMNPGHVSAPVT